MVRKRVLHYYKLAREHQAKTYGLDGLHVPDGNGGYRSARQHTGGGAFYQHHAIAAYNSARSHIHFIDNFPGRKRARRR